MPRVFFDSSVLLYTVEKNDSRSEKARTLLLRGGVISVQALNEFVNVSRRKLKLDWPEIEGALNLIRRLCEPVQPVNIKTHESGLQIAQRYGYTIYDSLMIASAIQAGCSTLYSEDMQDGQIIGPLTIRDPFLKA
jgi:predicted nucleic acid-binding protein